MKNKFPKNAAAFIVIALIGVLIIIIYFVQSRPPNKPENESQFPIIEEQFSQERTKMVNRAIDYFNLENQDVIMAMRSVLRHKFVPQDLRQYSYADTPLPIGYGQTISAPYIVAWMTELLELKAGDKVLEIGTGSGYQAAVLAQLGYAEVYSIEIVSELAAQAATHLRSMGFDQIHLRQGDGYFGWLEAAPFDAIIVTAAPDHLPQPLIQQLAEGGRLVIPIGPIGSVQTMWKFTKINGELKAQNLGDVRFVPLVSRGQLQPLPTPAE